jgi:hypothetical protein
LINSEANISIKATIFVNVGNIANPKQTGIKATKRRYQRR